MCAMKLSAAAWSFRGATLAESAAIWHALGIHAMDLYAPPGGLLDAREIARDPQGQARRVRQVDMELVNLIYLFGGGFDDHPLTSADSAVQAENLDTCKRVLEFCVGARVPSLLVLPGVDHPDVPHADSLGRSADALNAMAELANGAGIRLYFEPHKESVLESPGETLAFMRQNPALKIALDYAHFVAQGYGMDDIDPLAAYAGHVHLRQASKGHLQADWESGEIDFTRVMSVLKQAGYDGYVALEYEHDPWLELVDVMTESILMRDLVRPLL
jgi:sugar phosphate isomerase/epimerase